mgnify:CR=1 FL=1
MARTNSQQRRLQFIHARIKNDKYPNCRTLAEDFEGVSTKTIQRDLDYLRYDMNAPLEYDYDRKGYYYSENNFEIPAISMSESDLFAVYIAENALKQYRSTPIYDKLLKVFKKIEDSLPDKVTIDPSWVESRFSFLREPETDIHPDIWETVAEALKAEKRMIITYKVPRRHKATTRKVDPYHILCYRSEWYMIGFCHSQQDIRTFAVSRIQDAELTGEDYLIPSDFDIKELMGSHFGIIWGRKEYTVRIRFDRKQAPYVRERQWQQGQKIKENKDGSIVLSFQTNDLYEVRCWVLSWGGSAKVLGPKELKEDVKAELGKMVKSY